MGGRFRAINQIWTWYGSVQNLFYTVGYKLKNKKWKDKTDGSIFDNSHLTSTRIIIDWIVYIVFIFLNSFEKIFRGTSDEHKRSLDCTASARCRVWLLLREFWTWCTSGELGLEWACELLLLTARVSVATAETTNMSMNVMMISNASDWVSLPVCRVAPSLATEEAKINRSA
jgi:hypothetical protein